MAGPVLVIVITGILAVMVLAVELGDGLPGSDAVAVAVLLIVPLNDGLVVPVMVKVTLLPAPTGMFTRASTAVPLPVPPEVIVAVPVAAAVQLAFNTVAGMASWIRALIASLGPVLPTTTL